MSKPPIPARTGASSRSALGGHLPVLDGVRGLAILAVLLFHFVAGTEATNAVERLVKRVLTYGSLGVDLFFILSGFLITGILYDSRTVAGYFRNFYMRRVLRIFPLYYGVLAVVFFLVPLVPALSGSPLAALREQQAWAWLYAINIYLSIHGDWTAFGYFTHFWSLAVEEHFYFVWPLVVFLLGGRPRLLVGTAASIAALSYGSRVAASLAGVNPVATTVFTPFQLDALCLGGLFAVLARQEGGTAMLRRGARLTALAGATLLLVSAAFPAVYGHGSPVTTSFRSGAFRLLFIALLLHAVTAPASHLLPRFFTSRSMVWLGKYSYGIYVYHHFPFYYFVLHRTEFALAEELGSHTLAVVVQAGAGIAASMLVAWLSYECFEKHFLRLKRFWPSASNATGAAL
jgi:peptidoglycan/LPS O-acetylase OafA/YrhL